MQGRILVGACSASRYPRMPCEYRGEAPAQAREVTVSLGDMPAGRYAVVVMQDLDGDGRLRRGLAGMPLEPVGFANDAPLRFGPPAFDDAAVEIDGVRRLATVRLRYR